MNCSPAMAMVRLPPVLPAPPPAPSAAMLVTITALRRESGLDQGGGDAGGDVNGGCATTREGSDGAVGGCATTLAERS